MIIAADCPHCGVERGRLCVDQAGNTQYTLHPRRQVHWERGLHDAPLPFQEMSEALNLTPGVGKGAHVPREYDVFDAIVWRLKWAARYRDLTAAEDEILKASEMAMADTIHTPPEPEAVPASPMPVADVEAWRETSYKREASGRVVPPVAEKTPGGHDATSGAMLVLQFGSYIREGNDNRRDCKPDPVSHAERAVLHKAVNEVSSPHEVSHAQKMRLQSVGIALSHFLAILVESCPPGPERSTAINRALEAKMWGSLSIALEGK